MVRIGVGIVLDVGFLLYVGYIEGCFFYGLIIIKSQVSGVFKGGNQVKVNFFGGLVEVIDILFSIVIDLQFFFLYGNVFYFNVGIVKSCYQFVGILVIDLDVVLFMVGDVYSVFLDGYFIDWVIKLSKYFGFEVWFFQIIGVYILF